jgi:hypothetical protein
MVFGSLREHVNLYSEQDAELRASAADRHVPVDVALRARIVLWADEDGLGEDIAESAGASARTWIARTGSEVLVRGSRSGGPGGIAAVRRLARCRRGPASG